MCSSVLYICTANENIWEVSNQQVTPEQMTQSIVDFDTHNGSFSSINKPSRLFENSHSVRLTILRDSVQVFLIN